MIFVINGEVHNLVTCATIGLSPSLLKSGGLRVGHAGNNPVLRKRQNLLERREKPRNPVSRWLVAEPSGNSDL